MGLFLPPLGPRKSCSRLGAVLIFAEIAYGAREPKIDTKMSPKSSPKGVRTSCSSPAARPQACSNIVFEPRVHAQRARTLCSNRAAFQQQTRTSRSSLGCRPPGLEHHVRAPRRDPREARTLVGRPLKNEPKKGGNPQAGEHRENELRAAGRAREGGEGEEDGSAKRASSGGNGFRLLQASRGRSRSSTPWISSASCLRTTPS